MFGIFMSTALAQAAPAASNAAAAAAKPGFSDMLVPMIGIIFVLYFFMARPNQKKMKEHQDLIKGLKRGDQVITNGGILGEITNMTEKVVTLQVADNVRIKVVRSQILGLAKEATP